MKDITSTSFGLVIAFLLPGLVGLYAMVFWFTDVAEVFSTFLTSASNLGLFLLVVSAALSVGLLVTVFRWILFELWWCRSKKIDPAGLAQLGTEAKLVAFRAAIDEHYRYHQFWGGMFVVLPLLYTGLLRHYWNLLTCTTIGLSVLVFISIELGIGAAAIVAFDLFMTRANHILKGA